MSREMWDVLRFLEAQNNDGTYFQALKEIENGKKQSCWIWFVFPQLRGLGSSSTSYFYGLEDEAEAEDYYNNHLLRSRLIKITQATLDWLKRGKTLEDIFGRDAKKVVSCMEIFYEVSKNPLFKEVLEYSNED